MEEVEDDRDALIAKLRQLLNETTQGRWQRYEWTYYLRELMREAFALDPEYYKEIWIPYLASLPLLTQQPLFDCSRAHELLEYVQLVPFATSLFVQTAEWKRDPIERIVSTPAASNLHTLKLIDIGLSLKSPRKARTARTFASKGVGFGRQTAAWMKHCPSRLRRSSRGDVLFPKRWAIATEMYFPV